MARFVEVRRHTDNDGDVLTPDGVAAALRLGDALAGGYRVAVSTGAQRATKRSGACWPRSGRWFRMGWWSSRGFGRPGRTAGGPSTGRRAAASWRRCGRPTPGS